MLTSFQVISIFVSPDTPYSGGAPSLNMGCIVKPLAGAV